MAGRFRNQRHWFFCIAALAAWFAIGWPALDSFLIGATIRGSPVHALWLACFALFGTAVLGAMALRLRTGLQWILLGVQLAAVVAMAAILPWAMMSVFLIIIAWQAGMATTPGKALGWVAFQTLAVIATLAQALNPDLCWVIGKSFALQLLLVFTAQALRREGETARALERTNRELRSAQAVLANTVRDAERLRISRELHDAWGHELTALGLQLEIASHVAEPGRANDHVMRAKGLAGALLAKVRGVVATLREVERCDLKDALEALAQSVPAPAVRADTMPGMRVSPGQAHALMRCAQDDAGGVRHGRSSTAWLEEAVADKDGPLPARNDCGDRPGPHGGTFLMAGRKYQHRWIFCIAALTVWFAVGWPFLREVVTGTARHGVPVTALWLAPFGLFGAAALGAMALKLRTGLQWALLCVQLAAVVAMVAITPRSPISVFLIIIAWQVGMATTPRKALGWVAFQTLAVIGTLAPGLSHLGLFYIVGLALALQLLLVFTAQALRREGETARALIQANRELRSAQAVIANTVRDAERLRISRELHDAWGHELTALGLELEIASRVTEPGRANHHVMQAKGSADALLTKVRDVVSTLREAECCDLKDALEALAQSIPTPAIHVDVRPDVRVSPDQAHALMRCAQEAVTNAVKHAQAANLWLHVTSDGEGVRLVARNDGSARPTASSPGSGLLGMRERVESLGGRLAVKKGVDFGFIVDAWLPSGAPQPA